MKTFNTYQELIEATGNQLTAQQVINKRVYIKADNWQAVEFTPEFMDHFNKDILNVIGGHQQTRARLRSVLEYSKPQHWALARIILNDYGQGARFTYCAGQDHPAELQQLRNYLKK